jgi:hypothetical protein
MRETPDEGTDKMSKVTKTWILILVAGLLAGVVGVIKYGWQKPGRYHRGCSLARAGVIGCDDDSPGIPESFLSSVAEHQRF